MSKKGKETFWILVTVCLALFLGIMLGIDLGYNAGYRKGQALVSDSLDREITQMNECLYTLDQSAVNFDTLYSRYEALRFSYDHQVQVNLELLAGIGRLTPDQKR